MRVRVNGEELDVPEPRPVAELLGDWGFVPRAVAVAVNREVVPRSKLGELYLREGDEVEVIRAVGGG